MVAVAAPVQNACISKRESVLQSSRQELIDRPFYPGHQMTEFGTSAHRQKKNKNDDGFVQLGDMWKYIQGSHNWNGMLNPLHPLLLSEIVRYGVFARACYEAFDVEPGSKFRGFCKYGRKSLFSEVGMEISGYQVTKYIYAAPDINIPGFIKNKLKEDRTN